MKSKFCHIKNERLSYKEIDEDIANEQIIYKDELEREKKVLKNIDKIPVVNEEKILRLFDILDKSFNDVRWVGRSIYIASSGIHIRPPYNSDSIEGEASKDFVTIKGLLDAHN